MNLVVLQGAIRGSRHDVPLRSIRKDRDEMLTIAVIPPDALFFPIVALPVVPFRPKNITRLWATAWSGVATLGEYLAMDLD